MFLAVEQQGVALVHLVLLLQGMLQVQLLLEILMRLMGTLTERLKLMQLLWEGQHYQVLLLEQQ